MLVRRFFATFMLALLPLAAFILPSCGNPACENGGEGCPCDKAIECGKLPFCKGWLCDGTCHMTDAPLAWGCPGGVCDGGGHCLECLKDGDCGPGHTCEAGNVCTRCDDGIRNGDETGVDCGGSCTLCPGTCNVDADCLGGYCWEGLCVRCDDGIQNGDETGIDCGKPGGHCRSCVGMTCLSNDECANNNCAPSGRCCSVPCEGCRECDVNGECHPGLKGFYVPWTGCTTEQVCNGEGGCGYKPGHACMMDDDCALGPCKSGICS